MIRTTFIICRTHMLDDRSLKIERARQSDEGIFVCRAENSVGWQESEAKLTVHCEFHAYYAWDLARLGNSRLERDWTINQPIKQREYKCNYQFVIVRLSHRFEKPFVRFWHFRSISLRFCAAYYIQWIIPNKELQDYLDRAFLVVLLTKKIVCNFKSHLKCIDSTLNKWLIFYGFFFKH